MSQVRGYDKVKEKRKELVGLIDTQLNILDTLNMSAWHEKVQELKDRVLTDSFKVLVVGEFKRGKSTFINAMLGQEVLPAYATPTTAIINEVKWGEHPKALLYPRGEKDAPPRSPKEVPFDKIEDYVVIKDDQTEKQAIHENPYEKAELFWPLDLCRNGIEIIDSPGLNEHDVRQKVTLDYLRNVDVVLFVISCTAPVSKSEVDVIDNIIIPAGHQDIFFICNRFDEVRRPKDKERVKNYCRSNLGSRTKSADYIFFISAADALDGRLDDDKEMLKQSGLLDVEVKLEHFLANERGRIKIVQPAIDLKYAVRESRKSVSQQSEGLKTSLDEVKKRHTKVQNSLHELKYKQNQIILKIKNFRDDLRMKIEHEGGKFYEETSNKVTEWVEDYQPQTSLGMIKVLSQKKKEEFVHEIVEYLQGKIEEEFRAWQEAILQPIITDRMEALFAEIKENIDDFEYHLSNTRLEFASGTSFISTSDIAKEGSIPLSERIIAGTLGMFIDIGSAAMGATFGYREMFKSIVPQLLLMGTYLALAGNLWNPVVLIAILLSGSLVQGVIKAGNISKKMKTVVGEQYQENLRSQRHKLASGLAEGIDKSFVEIQNSVEQELALEIQNLKNEVDSVLATKKKGQVEVDKRVKEFKKLSNQLNETSHKIDDLIAQVALM